MWLGMESESRAEESTLRAKLSRVTCHDFVVDKVSFQYTCSEINVIKFVDNNHICIIFS